MCLFVSASASSVAQLEPLSDDAGERAAPRRRQRHRRPRVPESGVPVPQLVPTKRVPDPHEDHAGSGSLSDGPGEPHPRRELRGAGSHHITQSPTLLPLLGRFLSESYTMLVSGSFIQSHLRFISKTSTLFILGQSGAIVRGN